MLSLLPLRNYSIAHRSAFWFSENIILFYEGFELCSLLHIWVFWRIYWHLIKKKTFKMLWSHAYNVFIIIISQGHFLC